MTTLPFPRSPDPAGLAALRRLMDANQAEGALTFGQLPGFLFALACGPEIVPPSDWLREVLGDDPGFDDEDHAHEVLNAMIAVYNEINSGVLERKPRLPNDYAFRQSVLENFEPESPIGAWSRGFARGHSWLSEDWEEYLRDEFEDEVLACVFVLSFFHSRERAQGAADDEGEQLEELAGRIRQLFEETMGSYALIGRSIHETLIELEDQDGPEPRRPFVSPGVIGRNDPCPCGSGKKHKKCCGQNVH